ncbi:LRR receptor-like serine threonine-protein kinase At4g08850 [Seminavis robusta]|uniref:LRR receptor-like serine threonine-protein kinase At4g08850 n=1 Tax=Seminavis robusta TaxID=568900 RepID=A0A9N8DH48_9STRA|nr:LRR receptor-like serine threonine-protein kinase At4g08850 [Seminavis robusta]|eukprot:Sro118_g057730.1 LRR receptor-like serine threonine-protein kinase At4g08850 (803) ;mRNA; r:52328-55044
MPESQQEVPPVPQDMELRGILGQSTTTTREHEYTMASTLAPQDGLLPSMSSGNFPRLPPETQLPPTTNGPGANGFSSSAGGYSGNNTTNQNDYSNIETSSGENSVQVLDHVYSGLSGTGGCHASKTINQNDGSGENSEQLIKGDAIEAELMMEKDSRITTITIPKLEQGNTTTHPYPLNLLPPIFDDVVSLPPPLPTTTVPAPTSVPGAQHVYGGFSRNPNSFGVHHDGDHTASNLQTDVIDAAVVEMDNQETHLLESTGTEPRIPNQRSKEYWRQRLLRVLSLEVNVVLLAVIVVLLIFLAVSEAGHTSSNSSQPTSIEMPPSTPRLTTMPTMAPATFLESLPDYTLSAMERAQSPQSKAYQWLIQNINNETSTLQDLPNWRLKQRFALATFYYSTRGDYWVKKQGWLDWETNECYWEQIPVDMGQNLSPEVNCNANGEIKALAFWDANSMEGTIPPEISLLGKSLQSIELNRQLELKGTIPTVVGLLIKLTQLVLSATNIDGSFPTELGQLQSLQLLHFHMTPIHGHIPAEIGQLRNLSALNLARTDLTGSVPGELYKLPGLQMLAIEECRGLETEYILQELISNTIQLRQLSLSSRRAGTVMSIPSELGKLTELNVLFLKEWIVQGTIPSELGQLTKLTFLNLHGNSISGNLPHEVFELTDLTYIDVSSNQLEGTLPPVLFSKLTQLHFLQLNNNQFVGSIPPEIGLASNLKNLELQNTALSGTLPKELLALESLKNLVLKNTSLSGGIPEQLCDKMYEQRFDCWGKLLTCSYSKVQSNTTVCDGTHLCGCDCNACPGN